METVMATFATVSATGLGLVICLGLAVGVLRHYAYGLAQNSDDLYCSGNLTGWTARLQTIGLLDLWHDRCLRGLEIAFTTTAVGIFGMAVCLSV